MIETYQTEGYEITVYDADYEIPVFVILGIAYLSLQDIVSLHQEKKRHDLVDIFNSHMRSLLSPTQLITLHMHKKSPIVKYRKGRNNTCILCDLSGLKTLCCEGKPAPKEGSKRATALRGVKILEDFQEKYQLTPKQTSVRTQEDIDNQTERMAKLPLPIQKSISNNKVLLRTVLPDLPFKTYIDDSKTDHLKISLIYQGLTKYGVVNIFLQSVFDKDVYLTFSFKCPSQSIEIVLNGTSVLKLLAYTYKELVKRNAKAQELFNTSLLLEKEKPTLETQETLEENTLPKAMNLLANALRIEDQIKRACSLTNLVSSKIITEGELRLALELLD